MKRVKILMVIALLSGALVACNKEKDENVSLVKPGAVYVQPAQDCGCGPSILAFQIRNDSTIAIASGGANNWPARQKQAVDLVREASAFYQMPTQGGSTQQSLAKVRFDASTNTYEFLQPTGMWLFPHIYSWGQSGLPKIKLNADKTIEFLPAGTDQAARGKFFFVEDDNSNLPIYK